MSDDSDSLLLLQARVDELTRENEALKAKIKIADLEAENATLQRRVMVTEVASEAQENLQKGILSVLGVLGIAGIAGVWGVFTNLSSALEAKLMEESTFAEIQENVTLAVTDHVAETARNQVLDDIGDRLIDVLQKDQEFQGSLVSNVTNKIAEDPMFRGQIQEAAEATTVAAISAIAQQAPPDSDFAVAATQVIDQRLYYVVTASSTEPADLRAPQAQAQAGQLTAVICPPKPGNRRFVVLVTHSSDDLALPLNTAQALVERARSIEPTAYILATEPATGIFFDPSACN
jgi:hypothetical protein